MARILVVDDEASVRKLFERLGAQHHWSVTSMAGERDALTAMKTGQFELAFVDVDLAEGVDGVALAQKLKEIVPGLGLVMMSGDRSNAERVEASGLGPMLGKPFELAAVERFVESRTSSR